jgi:hypothetical protein
VVQLSFYQILQSLHWLLNLTRTPSMARGTQMHRWLLASVFASTVPSSERPRETNSSRSVWEFPSIGTKRPMSQEMFPSQAR